MELGGRGHKTNADAITKQKLTTARYRDLHIFRYRARVVY
jgi:hypothetical protein